ESVVGVVEGLTVKEHISLLSVSTGVLSMALVFGLWCVYFDFVACKPPKSGMGWAFVWGYSHMPLVIVLTGTGVGILNVIADQGTIVPHQVRLLIASSVALFLAIIGLLEITLQKDDRHEHIHSRLSPVFKWITSAVMAVLSFWGRGLGAIALLSILVALVILQIGYSLLGWLFL
ncbi:MAG TPA: low temperature requirement protein A, partial [Xenococcaceae cyanobacterium]